MNRKLGLILLVVVIVGFGAFWGYRKMSPGDSFSPIGTPADVSEQAGANGTSPVPGEEIVAPAKPVVCVDLLPDQIVEVDGVPTLPCAYPADGERCAVICHVPNATPDSKHSILISFESMKAHMSAHEDGSDSKDSIGPCAPTDKQACTEAVGDM